MHPMVLEASDLVRDPIKATTSMVVLLVVETQNHNPLLHLEMRVDKEAGLSEETILV